MIDPTARLHANAWSMPGDGRSGHQSMGLRHLLSGAVVGRDCNVCDHVLMREGYASGRVTIKSGVQLWTARR